MVFGAGLDKARGHATARVSRKHCLEKNMAKKSFVISTVNLRRDKERVVEDMHKKLAQKKTTVLSHVKRESALRFKLFASYTLCAVMVGIAITISILQWQRAGSTPVKIMNKYSEPLSMLEADFQQNAISMDEYARYLAHLLVRFSSVPEKYRQGVPRLSSPEVNAKIDAVWGMLHSSTRAELELLLPQRRTHMVDLNGNLISVPGLNQ